MEILFKGMSKKTGQPVIGYHFKMLNEHGEMVDKIYKNCGCDKEEWGFMEIEPDTLEVFVEGETLFNTLENIEKLTMRDLDLHPVNFGNDREPIMRCAHCNKDVTDLLDRGFKFCPYCGGKAKIIKTYFTIWVKCLDCHATSACSPTEVESAKKWNKRAGEQNE